MEYIITCISHNRHENVYTFINKVGTDNIIFFVKDDKDKELYLQNGASNVIVSGSLMQSRNASLQYCFNLGKTCIQLSDDIENIMVNDYTGKRTHQYTSVKEVIDDIMPNFLLSKYKFAGFPPTNNPFFATSEFEFNKFIVGDFILIKPTPLRFDTGLKLKEDYDYTLQHLKLYGGCVRYGKYLCSFKHYSNKGGAVDYRTSELEQNTIKYLINKWGECIKLNPKRTNEILLNKKSIEILNSTQSTLF